jgi:hypothetical protein
MTGLREVVHFSFPFLVHFCIPGDNWSLLRENTAMFELYLLTNWSRLISLFLQFDLIAS